MNKKLLFFMVAFLAIFGLNAQVSNQSPEQMQADVDVKKGQISALQGEIDVLNKNLATADVAGWRVGGTGGATFSANGNQNWASLSDDNSGLNVNTAVNVFGNYQNETWLWFNGLNVQQNFLATIPTGIFDEDPNLKLSDLGNLTMDKLYFQSLGGRRLSSELSVTGLFDLSSSFGKFLSPGQISAGAGLTWTPNKTMNGKLKPLRVVFHPLTWLATIAKPLDADDVAFSNVDAIRNGLGLGDGENIRSSFGTKFIADYARTLKILGNSIGWTTQIRGFAPYTSFESLIPSTDGTVLPSGDATGPWTIDWENAFSVNLFRNIALSANWNLRKYQPETTYSVEAADGTMVPNEKHWQHLWNAGFGLSTTF